MKNTVILSILTIVITNVVLIRNPINSNISKNNMIHNNINTVYAIDTETYTYTADNNNVVIKYPVLSLNNTKLASANKLIKDTVLSIFKVNNNIEQTIDVNYTIEYESDSLVSIVFRGLANAKPSAYPTNILVTLNIDMRNYSKVKLNDIYNINNKFVDIYKNNFVSQISKNIAVVLDDYSNEEIKNYLINADTVQSIFSTYYSGDKLIIVLSVPHVIGDYLEVEINKEDIIENYNI